MNIYRYHIGLLLKTSFNNISVLSWQSALLVEETGALGRKPSTSHKVTDKHYHIMVYRVHLT